VTGPPLRWELRPLSEVADVRLGRQRSPKNHTGPQMRPYLRAANVGWSGLLLDDVKQMNFTDAEMSVYALRPGDLLLSEASGSPDEVGKPAIWSGELEECAFQNTLVRVRPMGPEPRYLLHYFRYLALSGQFSAHARGVGIHHIGRARLAAWPIPLPPTVEQQQIVDILEDHLSRLDATDTTLEQVRQRLTGLQDRLLKSRLLGESVDGQRLTADLQPAGVDDGKLDDLPVGWHWRRLGDLADIVGGVTKDAKRQGDPAFVEVPYLRVANVQRGRLDLRHVTTIRVPPAKAATLVLRPGDVLLNEGGDRDKLARGWIWQGQVERCIHQNHVFRARVRDGQIEPRLLSWAANTIGAPWAERNGKQSVNLASISLSKIRLMPIPVPPTAIQDGLVASIEEELAATRRLTQAIDLAKPRATALRRSLLAAALSGRLTGRSADMEIVEEMAGV
jgi:type I restriction enzyme, S subunit